MTELDSIAAVLGRVVTTLRLHHVDDFAFTGGVAVGVWSSPRQTKDIDVCGVLPAEEVDRLLAQRDGVRSGGGALPDMVRFRIGAWDVDLFVSKSAYDRACLSRAVSAKVDDVAVRVVTAEDLLIQKMIKLRSDRRRMLQDLADIRAVMEARRADLDWAYLAAWLEPSDQSLLRAVTSETDEDIARRLLGIAAS